jgi:hypothetical protein
MAASRLERDREQQEIAAILSALAEHRYSEAAIVIDKVLSDGTRLARWTDPEIALLEAELERVTSQLADLETEQVELGHLVSRFQAAHNAVLGERVRKLLKLRLSWLEHQLKTNPEKQSTFDQASRDFDDFQRDQDIQKETNARTKWDLTQEEQKELKNLFRKGSKKCHPDLVPAEHQDAAAQMFRELCAAYQEGDLEQLRQLVKRAEAGLFDAPGETEESEALKKNCLKVRIAAIREAMKRTSAAIDLIKRSPTYLTMTENADWGIFLEDQAVLLDEEIQKLTGILEEMQDDE